VRAKLLAFFSNEAFPTFLEVLHISTAEKVAPSVPADSCVGDIFEEKLRKLPD